MGSKQTTARYNARNGELAVQQHETESPILPVAQLEKLHNFRPDLVDFVVQETQAEAAFRRKETIRTNIFVFIERMAGIISALIIGASCILGGVYLVLRGQAWAGVAIVSAGIGGLAVAFVQGRVKNKPTNKP